MINVVAGIFLDEEMCDRTQNVQTGTQLALPSQPREHRSQISSLDLRLTIDGFLDKQRANTELDPPHRSRAAAESIISSPVFKLASLPRHLNTINRSVESE